MDLYDAYLSSVKKDTYTFSTLISYADQMLATYQEELNILRRFRDVHINNAENSNLLKTGGFLMKPLVNSNIITIPLPENHPLIGVRKVAKKLHDRETIITTNIREISTIVKRLQQLKERV